MGVRYQIASVEHILNKKLKKVRGGGEEVRGILNISLDIHREPELKWHTEGTLSAADASQCWQFYFYETAIVSSQDENCTALIFSRLVE